MPRRRKENIETYSDHTSRTRHRKARTVEGRENQLIALATDKVEERIRNGTASSQEYVHFLRLGATREKQRLENEKLELELKLIQAKTDALESAQRNEGLFRDVIKYMAVYQGKDDSDDDEDTDIF